MDTKTQTAASRPLLSVGLVGLLLIGVVLVAMVFANNSQSLPINLRKIEIDPVSSTDALEPGAVTVMTLPVIGTDNVSDVHPLSMDYDPDTVPAVTTIGMATIPDQEKPITVFLAGTAGCSSCGIEAQYLSTLLRQYGEDKLAVVFVDIYGFGGPETLAWFAKVMEATNLQWAIDRDGAFKNHYQVDLDSTVIMNRTGDILYRDNILTPYETLEEQLQLALDFQEPTYE